MQTQYNFIANFKRLAEFVVILWLLLIKLLFKAEMNEHFFISGLIFFFTIGLLKIWIFPDIKFFDKCMVVSRLFGVFQSEYVLKDIHFKKKVLTVPKYGLVGEFPRYLQIILRNNHVTIIPSFVANYEEIINFLEINYPNNFK